MSNGLGIAVIARSASAQKFCSWYLVYDTWYELSE